MPTTIQPVSRADIERVYAEVDAVHIELSADLVEHHIRRGRHMRAQVAAEMLRGAGRGLKRLLGGIGQRLHGPLKPSNV